MSSPEHLADRFPADFLFGVATAAYQIEGAVAEDGRQPSIWDAFSHAPGRVVNGDTGDVACDHYHRWSADLDLIRQLGVGAYRFSLAWPRIIPDGKGAVNPRGLAFYDRLIDGCLERGLQTHGTLYHWDLPLALQERGGWANRGTAERFADYARVVIEHLGDRLDALTTFNEPWCSAYLGHRAGVHAPGLTSLDTTLAVIHHQHLAHGLAVQSMRSVRTDLPLGIVLNAHAVYPASDEDADHEAAQRHDAFHNGLYFAPLFHGRYPASVMNVLAQRMPGEFEADLEQIHQPLDYWGLNFYTPTRVKAAGTEHTEYPMTEPAPMLPTVPRTDIGWEIAPDTLGELINRLYEQYPLPPCYITENGAAFNDPMKQGIVADQRRIDYLDEHLTVIAALCESGVALKGYFAWSLMDNFEWAEGYTMRFGIVHVDYGTQVRTIKASGEWYANLARAHRESG